MSTKTASETANRPIPINTRVPRDAPADESASEPTDDDLAEAPIATQTRVP